MINDKDRKYELVEDDTVTLNNGVILHRIRALHSFGGIHIGDLGGYIETEENLSHDGNCWVYDDAIVQDSAVVYGDARIKGYARISGNAMICDNAMIKDNAVIIRNAIVCGNALIYGNVLVTDSAVISDNTRIGGKYVIKNKTMINGNANLSSLVQIDITKSSDVITFRNVWNDFTESFTYTVPDKMWHIDNMGGNKQFIARKCDEYSRQLGKMFRLMAKYVEAVEYFENKDILN